MHSEVHGGELECHDRSSAMARATLYPFCGCVDRIRTLIVFVAALSLQRQRQLKVLTAASSQL